MEGKRNLPYDHDLLDLSVRAGFGLDEVYTRGNFIIVVIRTIPRNGNDCGVDTVVVQVFDPLAENVEDIDLHPGRGGFLD